VFFLLVSTILRECEVARSSLFFMIITFGTLF
jgi:hypothetical protein